MTRRHLKLLVVLSLWLLLAAPVLGQEEVTDDQVNEVAKGLYCPVCESTPLDVCPTQACIDWRALIRQQLDQGMTRDEIFDYFAQQYGDGVLAEPPRRGLSLLLWLFPVVAVLIGGFAFSRYLRRLRAVSPAATATETAAPRSAARAKGKPALASYVARIEEELREVRE